MLQSSDELPQVSVPTRAISGHGGLAALNAGAIVIAGLYLGRELFVPIVLAVLLAFVLAPVVTILQRARLGKAPSVLIAVALAFVVIAGLGTVVGRQVTTLAKSLPSYSETIQKKVKSLTSSGDLVAHLQGSIQSVLGQAGAGTGPGAATVVGPAAETTTVAAVPVHAANASDADAPSALVIVRSVVQPVLGPLATLGVVVVFVVFVLLAREDLRDRLVRLVGRQDLHRTILAMNDAASRLSRYFLIQLAINTGFGVFIAAGLWLAGLPNPVLWGILAAMMRFVPFIGTFIAVLPPLLLALAVSPGWTVAAIVTALFVLGELAMGQVVEPLLYGQSTGLSPIAVIGAATFWGFLWGPVGLLIATPLTVCLVVVGRHVEALSFLDVILGDTAPLEPAETFYQRALEGNVPELVRQARAHIASSSAADYYDQVALCGLALAQADLARDSLAFERLEAIHQRIETLLETLFDGQAQPAIGTEAAASAMSAGGKPASGAIPPAEWRDEGAVLCIPGRGQLDDLAATMAMQILRTAGFGATFESHRILDAKQAGTARSNARLCCLSVLEQGSSPSGVRYLLRRIERQMPSAAVVVCLWHASGDSVLLAALRAEGNEETIVLSIGELVALARAISARRANASAPARLPASALSAAASPGLAATGFIAPDGIVQA